MYSLHCFRNTGLFDQFNLFFFFFETQWCISMVKSLIAGIGTYLEIACANIVKSQQRNSERDAYIHVLKIFIASNNQKRVALYFNTVIEHFVRQHPECVLPKILVKQSRI